MDERLDAHLDGELSADDLDERERAQVAAFEAQVAGLRAALDGRASDVDRDVMRRITELGLEPLPGARENTVGRSLGWLVAPRELRVRLRPVYGLAAAAAVAALVLVSGLGRRADPPVAEEAGATATTVYVQFRFSADEASSVALAGSFSGWRPEMTMQRSPDGVWTVLVPLAPGVHDYGFIIDGQRWVPDPYAPQVDDGFGGTNSRLTLLAPRSS